jgi:hypothetical protein
MAVDVDDPVAPCSADVNGEDPIWWEGLERDASISKSKPHLWRAEGVFKRPAGRWRWWLQVISSSMIVGKELEADT